MLLHLQSIQDLLRDSERGAFLNSAHVYPNGKFPYDQEHVVHELLRKKLMPDISNWADEAKEKGREVDGVVDTSLPWSMTKKADTNAMKGEDWVELWNWAAPAANNIIREVWMDEQGQDEDEDMPDEPLPQQPSAPELPSGTPRMQTVDVLRFVHSGKLPPGMAGN